MFGCSQERTLVSPQQENSRFKHKRSEERRKADSQAVLFLLELPQRANCAQPKTHLRIEES
jgi:hypothetical protein